LSKFGGLASAGYYDMASRLVQQVRGLIVSTNQALVPTIAQVNEFGAKQVTHIYEESYRIISFFAVPTFCALLGMAPLITVWWTGAYSTTLTLFLTLLSVGWLANVLSGPAYFSGIGTGALGWNLAGHISYAALNVLLGFGLGMLLSGPGVVLGATIALMTGSLVTLLGFNLSGGHFRVADLVPSPGGWALVAWSIVGSIGAVSSFFLFRNSTGAFLQTAIGLAIEGLTIGVISWRHPLRERLAKWVFHPGDPI
jgi:O-antigen/teichoic acid export membrane protein